MLGSMLNRNVRSAARLGLIASMMLACGGVATAASTAQVSTLEPSAWTEKVEQPRDGARRRANTAAEVAQPASARAGRVFGVFAGISVYPTGSSLPGCSSDAGRMYEIARYALGMQEEHGVLLTEVNCTKRAIQGAIEHVAAQMGPNDTLIFFYSGHGSQKRARGGEERDGKDETLAIMNARGSGTTDLTDNDLAEALGKVTRGRVVVVLDSCFSGGFAQDVVTTATRMGLFACREDQVAQVAMEKQAGGYLSAYFISAIGAQRHVADVNGDRTITAGELSRFIQRSAGGERGLQQELVISDEMMHPATPLFSW